MQMSFIVPIGDDSIYDKCFAASPVFAGGSGEFEIIAQRGYKSAAKAFNAGIEAARNDLVVICHQDIVLPRGWSNTLCKRVEEVARTDANWGIIGYAGCTEDGRVAAHVYRHDRELRGEVPLPARVRTLDESVIVFRKSSGLRFDETLLGFYFYAVDICLQAESKGLRSYAVDAPCFHQAKSRVSQQKSFFEAEKCIINKWKDRLPIQTLSGQVAGRRHLAYKRMKSRWDEFLALCGYRRQPWWTFLPKISPERILE